MAYGRDASKFTHQSGLALTDSERDGNNTVPRNLTDGHVLAHQSHDEVMPVVVLLNRMLKHLRWKLSGHKNTSARLNKLAQQLDGGAAVGSRVRGAKQPSG